MKRRCFSILPTPSGGLRNRRVGLQLNIAFSMRTDRIPVLSRRINFFGRSSKSAEQSSRGSRNVRPRIAVNRGLKQLGTRLLAALCLSALATPADPQAPEAHKPGEVFRDCPDCEELVVVPSGDFVMGSNDNPAEAPPHHVVIAQPFAVGRREVTFAEWDLCVAADVCKYTPSDHGWGRGERPVIDVSWEDTKPFITWLSQKSGQTYRLLTEAEWEYASRAGTVSSYWWGKDVGVAKAKCLKCGGDLPSKPCRQDRSGPTGSAFSIPLATRPSGFKTAGTPLTAAPRKTAPPGTREIAGFTFCAAVRSRTRPMPSDPRRASDTTSMSDTTPTAFGWLEN